MKLSYISLILCIAAAGCENTERLRKSGEQAGQYAREAAARVDRAQLHENQPLFEFRSIRIGSDQTEIEPDVTDCRKSDDYTVCKLANSVVAGLPTTRTVVRLDDTGRVDLILVSWDLSRRAEIIAALTQAYGEPCKTASDPNPVEPIKRNESGETLWCFRDRILGLSIARNDADELVTTAVLEKYPVNAFTPENL